MYLEPPQTPTLGPLKTIGNCTNCIVGEDKKMVKISCEVNGGSEPFTVNMKIGGIPHEPTKNDGKYHTYLNLTSTDHHMATVTCTVTNTVTNISLTTEAYIYVIKCKFDLT